jgi:hypothetical protein
MASILAQTASGLIIDTEQGHRKLSGIIAEINNRDELIMLMEELRLPENVNRFRFGIVDTIDKIVDWIEAQVLLENNATNLSDIPYGGGFYMVRTRITNFLLWLKATFQYSIIIGHLKRREIGGETEKIVKPDTLDLNGKLKNLIMADADAIGYVYRGKDQELRVSFKSNGDITEAGSRCIHLRNADVMLADADGTFVDWSQIYKGIFPAKS